MKRMLLCAAALASFFVVGCSDEEFTEANLNDKLVEEGIPAAQAKCISAALFDEFSASELEDAFGGDGEPPEDVAEAMTELITDCVMDDMLGSTSTTAAP